VAAYPQVRRDSGPLVRPQALAGWLESADPPVLLDVRWYLGGPPGVEAYLAGHLPGARFIDLDTELSGAHRPGAPSRGPGGSGGSGGRHPLPDPDVFENAMWSAGVHDGQPVVVYDDGDATIASRLWWMLRHYGHDNVAVLDGGFQAWVASGGPVSTDVPHPERGDFRVAGDGRLPVLDADDAAALARSGFLLDARQRERYRGETEPVDPAAGHIPGAISAATRDNVGPDGTFLPAADLARRFAGLGVPMSAEAATGPDGRPVVGVYCGSGVTATHEILALDLIGVPAALYVGSWSDWSSDPARPVATGPDPG
jgi:thiosulfate/3-mercaptopyruvate sulfurtransferase